MVNGPPEDLGHFAFAVMREVGAAIGHMHDSDVVHGDLTTSNIMIRKVGSGKQNDNSEENLDFSGADPDLFQVVLIDFGLGMTQPSVEDRAVDLYVLERAFLSTHPGSEQLVRYFPHSTSAGTACYIRSLYIVSISCSFN